MGHTILLSDDDENILETAKDILEASDYTVLTATTGAESLALLQKTPCDLMIVDFNLPDTKGVDLALKARAIRPAMPVILMTGEAHVELGAAKAAIQAVLTKPVNPSDLLALIKTHI